MSPKRPKSEPRERDQRFENWKLRRALARPYFLRSTTRLSHALTHFEPELRKVLKPHGFLTRDARVVERKKYGRAKARRSFQFSKR